MPELPEVETTRRGLAPHVTGRVLKDIVIRQRRLRWPIPRTVRKAVGHPIHKLDRRAKWLLFDTGPGSLLAHLGMSGSMRVLVDPPPPGPHDHLDLILESGTVVRFTDPRRFGAWLWQPAGKIHERLASLGPEPLGPDFDGEWLWRTSRGRRAPVKAFIMASRVVVGVGNIYAAEALYAAGIHPARAAGRISRARYDELAQAIRDVLAAAIAAGGTTLRDFTIADGSPGYFEQELQVYGQGGEPCPWCGHPLISRVIAQRGTVYCGQCQR